MTRVAHLVLHYAEGLGYEENHLGFEQASLGVDVSIVAPSPLRGWSTRAIVPQNLVLKTETPGRYSGGVSLYRLKPGFQARHGTQLVLRRLKDTIKTIDPDILHIHSPVGILTIQALATAKSLGKPVVIDNHLCYHNLRPYGHLKRIYYFAFGRTVLKRFDSIIYRYLPLTRDCEEVLHRELGVPRERMTHSTLGADTEAFAFKSRERDAIRSQLGIPADASVIAFVGE